MLYFFRICGIKNANASPKNKPNTMTICNAVLEIFLAFSTCPAPKKFVREIVAPFGITCSKTRRNQVYWVIRPTAATALSEYPDNIKTSILENARKRRFSITSG